MLFYDGLLKFTRVFNKTGARSSKRDIADTKDFTSGDYSYKTELMHCRFLSVKVARLHG